MEINVYVRTYNLYGGHVTLSLTGDFLTWHAPSFGDAIQELEVTMHFRTSGPPRKTLKSLYEEFHAGLDRLPTVTFRRKQRRAEIAFYSTLCDGRDVDGSQELSLALFCDACREVVQNVNLLQKRLRPDDEFDFSGFRSWLDHRLTGLPRTAEQLAEVQSQIHAQRDAVWESLSEWERLGIDFEEFHGDARLVVDHPPLWDVCEECAPNGNDTGADVLELYRDWRKRNRRAKSSSFFSQLMHRWGVPVPPDPEDEDNAYTYNQAIVGLAFAQLKLEATCSADVASLALEALESQRSMPEPNHWDAELCESRRQMIDRMEQILKKYA